MILQLDQTRYINYEAYGERDEHPIVLLHGNGEDNSIFRKLAGTLSEFYYVLAFDSPGHGDSYRLSTYSYPKMANDIREALQLLNISKPLIVGYSDGGIIALLMARQDHNGLAALVLCGANLYLEGLLPESVAEMQGIAARQMATKGKVSPLLRLMLEQEEISLESLRDIPLPALVVAGENDIVAEEHSGLIAAALPQGRLIILPGETHGSYIVDSDLMAPYITELREIIDVYNSENRYGYE